MAVTPDWVAPEEQPSRIKGYEELMSRKRTAKEINDSNAIKWGNVKVRVGPLDDCEWDDDDHFELEGE